MTNPPKMSDVPMYPQPPSNEDGFFGRSEPDFDQDLPGEGAEVDENSWLLDEGESDADASETAPSYEAVQPLPGEFNERHDTIEAWGEDGEGPTASDFASFDPENPEDALDAFADGLTKTDPMVGASFVEPEPATRAFSRALVPAGAALLVSFCGIAVWAFIKKPVTDTNPTDIQVAAPDVVKSLEGTDVDLVTPLGLEDAGATGRISFRRDGSTKVVGGKGGATAPAATVKSPREPGELPNGRNSSDGDNGRPSFSAFGSSGAAVKPKDTTEVEEAPEGLGQNDMVDATEFQSIVDQDVATEMLDTFGSLEDDLFLPQEFMDSFVLSIDPIDDVASIYGDINTREEVDSFADLDFARSTPFDSQGFGDFGVSQWEGMGESSNLADAEAPAEEEYDVFLPFGMFNDDDDLVASVDVVPELSVTAVSTEEQLSDSMESVAEEAIEVTESTEVAEVTTEESPAEMTEDGTDQVIGDGSVTEDPLLALFGLPEAAEPEPMEDEVAIEVAIEVTEEVTLEPTTETVAQAVEPDFEETPVETEGEIELSEPEIEEVLEEAPKELVAEAEAPVIEYETELKTEEDLAAAHARLDSMFGVPTFEESASEEVASIEETQPENQPETETEPELDPQPELMAEPEVLLAAEIPSEESATTSTDEVTVETVTEELPMETEVEMVAMETEVEAEPVVETPAEVLVAEVEPEPEAVTVEPEVEVASVTPEPSTVEVLESIVDDANTTRYASALRRTDSKDVWANRTVPKSKVGGDRFVLTPNVGNVRIIFDGGESIDGRLHGVGAQKIVLDTKLGRMTLDARRADRIDRLGGGKRAELRSPSESYASTKGLDRVKVRAAGGVFYGYLIAQSGEKVTLLLDDGVRVTLNSTEVETSKARKSTSRMNRR